MSSLRNTGRSGGLDHSPPSRAPERSRPDDALLDAARASIVAVGWRRSTLTDVARRAGVSRMTLYRRWPDMVTLLADLMTREWSGLGAPGHPDPDPAGDPVGDPVDRLARGVASSVSALRDNDLFRQIVRVDPELLLPYLLERRGRTQDALLSGLEAGIAEAQHDGAARAGDPALLARTVLLAAHGFALSAATMTDRGLGPADLDGELRRLVDGYLRP